ncbi:RepB family plasmid replication initiator protein, partial [Candidatus Parcubacteria bacterium]
MDKKDKTGSKHLAPAKHRQLDFFIADAWSADPRDDIASMEHPIFALKAGDTRDIEYEHNGIRVAIRPTSKGRATIFDKDIWIYCMSRLVQALDAGADISRT